MTKTAQKQKDEDRHYTSTLNVSELNVSELNAKRILNSVKSEMIKKGYTEDNHEPDLMINVVSLLKDKKIYFCIQQWHVRTLWFLARWKYHN